MPLPSTITLNVGSPAADVVYGSLTHQDGTAALYYAPSPQGDLEGRPTLRISHETTAKGITRTLVSFVTPKWDAVKGAYVGFTKVDLIVNRSIGATVASVMTELEKMTEVLPTLDDFIASATI